MTKNAVSEFKGQSFQSSAIMEAAEADRMVRVHPSDAEDYRLWVIVAPQGSITIWDQGNGWTSIDSINDMPHERETAFWRNLARHIADNPTAHLMQDTPIPLAELLSAAAL